MKTCRKCGVEKEGDQFSWQKGKPNSYCRECVRKINKARFEKIKSTGEYYDGNYKISIIRTITYASVVINAPTEQVAVSQYLSMARNNNIEIKEETFRPTISRVVDN